MLPAYILGSTPRIVDYFHRACVGVQGVQLPHVLDQIPPLHQLLRMMSVHQPAIVFLEVDPTGRTYQLAVDILAAFPGTRLIGFAGDGCESLVEEAAEFGLAGVLTAPFDERTTYVAVQRTLKMDARQSATVTVFQPATGGVGATTTAVNVAAEMTERHGQRTLYIDGDLRSSPLSYWFDVDPRSSILEAIENSQSLDDARWASLVSRVRNFDALFAPRQPSLSLSFSSWDVMRIISYATLRYDQIVVDLPVTPSGEMEALISRADRRIVVCSPEAFSLAMGRRRLDEMMALGAEPGTLAVALNRTGSGGVKASDAAAIVKAPIAAELPDDGGADEGMLRSVLSSKRTKLVKAYRALADKLVAQSIQRQQRTQQPRAGAELAAGVSAMAAPAVSILRSLW